MPGMMTAEMHSMHSMAPRNFTEEILHHATSGTSAEPNSTPMPMMMTMHGPWMLMFHANVFITDEQQSSPRGGDKFFSTNWFMPMAQRHLGPGQLRFAPCSAWNRPPSPTVAIRCYSSKAKPRSAFPSPTASIPTISSWNWRLSTIGSWASKRYCRFTSRPWAIQLWGRQRIRIALPLRKIRSASLGHHQQDSTHIADDVATVGVTYKIARVEASGFHGREPDEFRWNIDQGEIDSWSTRLTVQPGQNWSAQYSYGRITSPEELFPDENQARTTASVMYNRQFKAGNLASTILWGRTRSIPDNGKENSYLLEATLNFLQRNYVWTRMENAGRSNELLIGENPLPPGFTESPLTHVQAYTFGYDRDFNFVPHLASAIGSQFTVYGVGAPLQPIYGSDPIGVNVFIRLRPF